MSRAAAPSLPIDLEPSSWEERTAVSNPTDLQTQQLPAGPRSPKGPHLNVAQFIERLRERYSACITGELIIPERRGEFSAFPETLDERVQIALRTKGIDRLYTHQRSAWEATQLGKHVVVVTPTASG